VVYDRPENEKLRGMLETLREECRTWKERADGMADHASHLEDKMKDVETELSELKEMVEDGHALKMEKRVWLEAAWMANERGNLDGLLADFEDKAKGCGGI